MTQQDLRRAVARATGETLATIAQRGFQLADPAVIEFDPEPASRKPAIVNWDALEAKRLGLFPGRRRRATLV